MNGNILLQPQYNPAWQAVWRERLERAGESCLRTWLEHQSYDQYWRHGSVCEDYTNIQIPVLLFGGWHDGYTNAAFRFQSGVLKWSEIRSEIQRLLTPA